MEDYEGHQHIKMDFWLLGKEKLHGYFCQVRQGNLFSYARMVFLFRSLWRYSCRGSTVLSDLSGPVGAVSVVSDAVKTSLSSMLENNGFINNKCWLVQSFPDSCS